MKKNLLDPVSNEYLNGVAEALLEASSFVAQLACTETESEDDAIESDFKVKAKEIQSRLTTETARRAFSKTLARVEEVIDGTAYDFDAARRRGRGQSPILSGSAPFPTPTQDEACSVA